MGVFPSAPRSTRLRELISSGVVMMPGAFNALSARMIEHEGFSAMYLSGAVLANSVGGVPDVGLMTLTEARDHADHVARSTSLPILMDADTGYGGIENASRTVRVLESIGVSGIHLEDQEFPKRCGHLEGKRLVPCDEFCEKIAAAAAAKRSKDFLLMARTDARGVEGYDQAVRRAEAYLRAGADGIFPEALESREEFARFAKDVPTILLANMTEFGRTPLTTADEFAELGYRIVIFPVTLQRIAMKAVQDALRMLSRERTQRSLMEKMQTRSELYDLIGYQADAPPAVPQA
ncbi:MAG: methylisocitrate lyase [Planctomycetota bacterium]